VTWAREQKGSPHHCVCNGEGVGAVRVPKTPAFSKGKGSGVESVATSSIDCNTTRLVVRIISSTAEDWRG
jgi:hypothetical protein